MWKQIRPFDLSKMGHKKGYCLQNVRLAYDIPPKYADAKEAMEANKEAGTLHDISTLPETLAVPVFVDTPSVNEHIEVADNPMSQKFFGWGETLNGVRIVEWIDDPVPVPPEPTPAPEPNKVWYTYKNGDTVGQVLKDLGLDEGNLWGDNGTVKYYTDQLWSTQPDIFDPNGNIKVGIPFYLIPR